MYKSGVRESSDKREFCTIQEAAQISGLALKTWYKGGAGTNIVPRIRFGRSIRLLRADVERFINARITEAKEHTQSNKPTPESHVSDVT